MDQITIKVCGNSYDIKYPNIGQTIDIKTRELTISRGQMSELMFLGSASVEEADVAIAVKTIAFFQIACPKLIDDLKVKSLMDLSVIDFLELRKAFIKQINPWLREWQTKIQETIKQNDELEKK